MEKEPHGSFSIYSHRANRRAISHAQHGVVVPAWVAFAKQLRLGQWQYLLIIEQPFEQLVACSNLPPLSHCVTAPLRQRSSYSPRGVRLPKAIANELKPNLFEFLQRVQQCFNEANGNKRLVNGSCPKGQTTKPQAINNLQPLQRFSVLRQLFLSSPSNKKTHLNCQI